MHSDKVQKHIVRSQLQIHRRMVHGYYCNNYFCKRGQIRYTIYMYLL